MRTFKFFFALFLFISCKENYPPNSSDLNIKEEEISSTTTENPKDIVWKNQSLKNFSFQLPNDFQLEKNLSNASKQVYANDEETLGVTIDIADLPIHYTNKTIAQIIPDLHGFSKSINQGNKMNFNDFVLVSEDYSTLGNASSVEVLQTSTMVSGKNIPMLVKSQFVVAPPYYLSVTFLYPKNSFPQENLINKIENSFEFNIPKHSQENQPSLEEAQNWLSDKLTSVAIGKSSSSKVENSNISTERTYKDFIIENGNLVIFYTNKVTIIERFPSFHMYTSFDDYQITIPFQTIKTTRFNSKRNYLGECEFQIFTNGLAIVENNLSTNDKTFASLFSFTFDCSEDENLGTRIDNAITHIATLTPDKKTQTTYEPF